MRMPSVWNHDAEQLPNGRGAYVLLIELDEAAPLPGRRFTGYLTAGTYCYLGNAGNPGGIRARCVRHIRRDKPLHWHVDWLTVRARSVRAIAQAHMTECDLFQWLVQMPGISVPVPGFGSSDCRRCTAHLVALAPGADAEGIGRSLAAG
jgi:Uri superfamily endonuclease